MEKLSIDSIIKKINNEECFEVVSLDYSFTLKIDNYVPYVCGAVHDGHNFRKELWPYCTHSEYERWYEEDPATKQMIQSMPIVIAGLDSRFEYDLNRPPETAIYEDAWGKSLWKENLPENIKKISVLKHSNYYKVVDALINKLEDKFTNVIVYDMHSYNWLRWDRKVPTWNIGTLNIDSNKYADEIELWREMLGNMKLPNGIDSTSKVNDTFKGNGYFLKYITQNFKNTLVLATEIAKVYCDELNQIIYPEVVSSVENQLKKLIPQHARLFSKNQNKIY